MIRVALFFLEMSSGKFIFFFLLRVGDVKPSCCF